MSGSTPPIGADAGCWIQVVAGVLSDGSGRVLISRRPAGSHQGGLWEFPGGKLEPGENPEQGLARELHEEIGIEVLASRRLIEVAHDYGDRRILLDVRLVSRYLGQPRGREGQRLAWRDPWCLEPSAFPPADRPVIGALRLPPLCLITPSPAPDPNDPAQQRQTTRFLDGIAVAISAGARLVQLRAHERNDSAYAALAALVAPWCEARGALLVLNRKPGNAAMPGAGYHLSAARLHALTPGARPAGAGLLGASCHTAADLAHAVACELDYACLSPVLATRSHPGAPALGWEGFAQCARAAGLPVYALGGLCSADLPRAWAAGGQGVAAIRGLWLA